MRERKKAVARLYKTDNGQSFNLIFCDEEVAFFTIVKIFIQDELGNTHECYVEESGMVLNDVIEGVIMAGKRIKGTSLMKYLKFVKSKESLEKISEHELSRKINLTVRDNYKFPF